MDPDYARHYEDLYRRHWWFRAREALILAELRRRGVRRDGHILDVGCGNGLLFDRLSEFGSASGVEIDASTVSPDGPHRDRIHIGPFDRDFQPGKQYSLILMLDVLEHLEDPLGALAHAVELLDRDGIMLITVPAFLSLWTSHDDLNHHVTRYTKRRFSTLAEAAGMRIDDGRYFFHWLVPAKLMVRLKESLAGAQPQPPSIPPALINKTLYAWCRCEQALCGRLPIPFGSSLLMVGGTQESA